MPLPSGFAPLAHPAVTITNANIAGISKEITEIHNLHFYTYDYLSIKKLFGFC